MGDVPARLIAFDLDGTLVDSRRDLAESANQLIVELGGAPLDENAIVGMVGEGAAVLVRRALAAAGLGDVPGAEARFLQIYDTRLLNHTRPYDGIAEAVRSAHRRGRTIVLTNKPTRPSERILEAFGLLDLFHCVLGGDTAFPRKPDPAALHAMMRMAGTSPQSTLLIGDSAIDHETAVRASAACCLVSYGFGYATFPPARLTGREWIAPDTATLRRIIEQF